jgi:hypothetical protein
MNAVDRLVEALERYGCNPRSGSASCPAEGHFPDKNPSLSYGQGREGAVVTCQRGCPVEDVLRPLWMTTADLFDEPRSNGSSDETWTPAGPAVAVYDYCDAAGRRVFRVTRTADKKFRQCRPDPTEKSGWKWSIKDVARPLPLYHLPKVLKAVAAGDRIVLCEGERDVLTLERLGFTGTTKAMGAGGIKWEEIDLAPLAGARVIVLPDHDADGTKYALGFLEAIGNRADVRIVNLPGLSDKQDVSDWAEAGGTAEQLEELVAGNGASPDEWPEILELSDSGPVEAFPSEELPPRVRAMVEAVAASSATPIDFPAGVALGAIAAIASRAVSIRPTRGDWKPPANIYFCAVLPSGEGKSPVHRELLGPLHEIEKDWQDETREDIVAARTRKTVAEQVAEKATKDAGTGKGSLAVAITLAQDADAIVVPPTPRLLTMEPTPEALLRICAAAGGTIAVVSDEGGDVFQLTARYSASGAANLGIYVSGFEGRPYVSDRASREPVTIERLVLSLVLAIQPGVLDDLAREKANRDRGFLARFLFCLPASHVGSRPTRRPEVPAEIREDWNGLLRRLADEVKSRSGPVVLELDDEAQEDWHTWCSTVEPRLHPDTGDLRHCVDWGSKAQAHVARLTALLHVAGEQPLETPVVADTLWSAITLWEYFTTHAKRAFATMIEAEELRIARKILRWIERAGVEQFTQREAHRGVEGGIVSNTDDLKKGLAALADRGYIRLLPAIASVLSANLVGRPIGPSYDVNPSLRTDNTDKTS